MTVPCLLDEPGRVDEPGAALEYSAVLTQVAAEQRPIIVRRNGTDLAAVIPLEHTWSWSEKFWPVRRSPP
jgi:prevent-host-death family protein